MTDIKTEALSLILSLLIIVAVIFTATRCSKSTLEPKQHKYNTETYKDDDVIYKIITDRAGDVIYCEPME